MIYLYRVHLGLVTLSKMQDGDDVDEKPKKVGKFKTEADAKKACIDHYAKACKMAKAAGRQEPQIIFV